MVGGRYFIPIQRPNLFLRPFLVSGIPVDFEIERFALVTPNARFHEKLSPGPSFIQPPEGTVSQIFFLIYRLRDLPHHQVSIHPRTCHL